MGIGHIPIFEIYKGNENITARFQDRGCEIKVDLASGGGAQDTCTITLDDRDWLISQPQVNDYLDIYLGYEGIGTTLMGSFEIDEVMFTFPPKGITIHGNAQGNNSLLKSQKVIEYDNKTVGEVLQSIGSAVGLEVKVNSQLAGEKIKFKNSHASPSHLVTQLEDTYNAVAKVIGGKLIFVPRDQGESATGQELPLLALLPAHFANYTVRHSNRSQYTKSSASYTDPKTNKREWVDHETAVAGLPGNSVADLPYKIGRIFNTEAEAKAAAKAMMASLDRNQGEGMFTLAEGDPWVRDQQRILVRGTRAGVDGSYVADLVSHQFTKQGALRTSISAKPPSSGSGSYGALYEQEPEQFIQPAPGQIMGQNLPSLVGQPAPTLE